MTEVPDQIDSITALFVAQFMRGNWQKRPDERDTEKAKRIYKTMISIGRLHNNVSTKEANKLLAEIDELTNT
jgi:hypothetical protein